MRKIRDGFTLIELLVVISIISLLSSIVLASLQTARAKGRDGQRFETIVQIRDALELYRLQNGSYPNTSATFDSSGNPNDGQINGTTSSGGPVPDGCPGAFSAGFNYVSFSGSYYNDNVIPGLVPLFMPHIPNDPSGKVVCMLYASDGTDYKFTEAGVLENSTVGAGNVFYDPTLSSSYPLNSLTIYTNGAANWNLSEGQADTAAP